MSTPHLSLDSISLAYEADEAVVQDVSLRLERGEFACLLGPSGCGKTSLLSAITGFLPLLNGQIKLKDQVLSSPSFNLPTEHRNIGMVFQDHALYPHLNVAQNIGFGLHKLTKVEQQARIKQMVELVGLSNHVNKYPHELSGGQGQRVAVARSVAPQPDLLLLDEPFSNLDAEMRDSLGYEIKSLLKSLNITSLLVTHDQHEAFALSDKIGVMHHGRLLQWDSPFNLYHTPATRFVANFVGDGVFLPGQLIGDNTVVTAVGEIQGELIRPIEDSESFELLLRPDDVVLDSNSSIRAHIIRKAFKGAQTLYTLELPERERVMALAPSHDDYEIGDEVGVMVQADHLVCF